MFDFDDDDGDDDAACGGGGGGGGPPAADDDASLTSADGGGPAFDEALLLDFECQIVDERVVSVVASPLASTRRLSSPAGGAAGARGANVREYLVRWPLAGGGGDGAATTTPGGAAADAGLPPHISWVREVGPSAGGLLRTARGWLGACMAAVERDGNDVASD